MEFIYGKGRVGYFRLCCVKGWGYESYEFFREMGRNLMWLKYGDVVGEKVGWDWV